MWPFCAIVSTRTVWIILAEKCRK